MHGLDFCNWHGAKNGLDIMCVAFLIIPPGIRREVANQMIQPKLKPCIDCHVRVCNDQIVPVIILLIGKPISCFRKCRKMLFFAHTIFATESSRVFTILPLADSFSTFLTFQVLTHYELLSYKQEKEPNTSISL